MGARKRKKAEQIKEQKKNTISAVMKNCPSSPRKMRLVADMVRGMEVNKALDILKHTPKSSAEKIEKLLLSAIANWQAKNEGSRIEESNLYIKEIAVDEGRTLRRIRPAPQGRAYVIRKRSNHVTILLGSKAHKTTVEEVVPEEEVVVEMANESKTE